MRRHVLSLTFVVAWACVACGYALLLAGSRASLLRAVSAVLLVPGLGGLAYCAAAAIRFRDRLVRFVRELVDGNYKAKLDVERRTAGEIAYLEKTLNRLAEQLQTYDVLRAKRVRLHHSALETVLLTVSDPILVVDVERESVSCNAAACALFETDQQTVSLRALQNAARNKPLAGLLRNAIETQKVPQEANVQFQFPGHGGHRKVTARIVPVKGEKDNVERAIVFLTPLTKK
jgi:PAS domain-containing protein